LGRQTAFVIACCCLSGEAEMTQGAWHVRSVLLCLGLAPSLAVPIKAYDFPLTSNAIRDAYFLGTRAGGLGERFLADYRRTIPSLRVAEFTSFVQIETPFVQVALRSGKALNYSAQDAVRDFLDKPAAFRLHLEICYMPDAPPNAVKIKLLQNKREILPESENRAAFYPPTDPHTSALAIGESIGLEIRPEKIDSSTLTVQIDTPDGRRAIANLDLQVLR
jgi:hypothetical protein